MPARRACWRKSGVVSMTTFWPLRERSREGRRRLSRGSLEVHTGHWQPRDGTPIEVPEPRTVSLSGFPDMEELADRNAALAFTESLLLLVSPEPRAPD